MSAKDVQVRATPEQLAAWSEAAGDQPIDAWLSALADEAADAGRERVWPVVITLKHPVTFGSEQVTSLTFRRGKAADLKGMKLGESVPTEQLLLIASRLCNQVVKVIESLDVDDAGEVMAIALDFYGRCLGNGRKR